MTGMAMLTIDESKFDMNAKIPKIMITAQRCGSTVD
jgi:hypothetical protein